MEHGCFFLVVKDKQVVLTKMDTTRHNASPPQSQD